MLHGVVNLTFIFWSDSGKWQSDASPLPGDTFAKLGVQVHYNVTQIPESCSRDFLILDVSKTNVDIFDGLRTSAPTVLFKAIMKQLSD